MAESAAMQTRTFFVRANGIRMENVNTANQPEVIERLKSANLRLHSGLRIMNLVWSARAIREKKVYFTLHIEVATATMANKLITEGLIENFEIKKCKRFTRGCTITQCFNCQRCGHVEKTCRNSTACGHCAGPHQSREYTAATKQHRQCAVCSNIGHEAWSTTCKIRQFEKRKAKIAMSNWAPLYPTIATQEPTPFGPLSFSFQGASFTDSTPPANKIPSTWTIVSGKKRKNNLAHTPELRSTPPPSGKKITWVDTGIMNPENMAKAMTKPTLGRPRAETVAGSSTPSTPATLADKMDL